MRFERIEPPPHLRSHVRFFWKLRSEDENPRALRIIADGTPGIFVHRPEIGSFHQNEKKMPALCLYGQATKSAQLVSSNRFQGIGAYLHPVALRRIFDLDADELTDTCTDLDLFSNSKDFFLSEKLFESTSDEKQIEILSNYLTTMIDRNQSTSDDLVDNALSEIVENRGNISLKELRVNVGISEKSLQRKFKRSVGVPPKLYSRICRFQASLDQLRQKRFSGLTDIAHDNDYSDQSHFIRSFRQFSGYSPKQLQHNSKSVLEIPQKENR